MKIQITWTNGEQQETEIKGYKTFDTGFIEIHGMDGEILCISPYNYRCFIELPQSCKERVIK